MKSTKSPKSKSPVVDTEKTEQEPWLLEDERFTDSEFEAFLTPEQARRLEDLGIVTMGAIWEYAANSDDQELLCAIDRYCAKYPKAPLPRKQPTPTGVDTVQAKAEAFDEVVRAQQVAAECFIIFENAKEAAKVAKEAYEDAKESVMSLVRNRNQEITNPQRVLF